MNTLTNSLVYVLLVVAFIIGQGEKLSSETESRYPNEMPTLKLYREAKWNAIQPYVSTHADVDRILGEPLLVYDDLLLGYVEGYEYDADWRIVMDYLGKGGDIPDSLEGRVSHITLYPKKRVSLEGVKFSAAFSRYLYTYLSEEVMVYYDKFGLRYSVYAKDSTDGRFHAGDLKQIIYGPSDEATSKYTNRGKTKP